MNRPLLVKHLRRVPPPPARAEFRKAVLDGLFAPVKSLPCKFLYDEEGARLFEAICALNEYYPTRTETSILRGNIREIARILGPCSRLVELGSGNSAKTRVLLDHLQPMTRYVPIDISRRQLLQTARALSAERPGLNVHPVCADYTRQFVLPAPDDSEGRTVAFFPGSTVGNFEPEEATRFLRRIGGLCGPGSGLLIGVDLKKDPEILRRAYNDASGITAAFNLNLLARANRELGTDFDLSEFRHDAVYNARAGRIEMRLVSRRNQVVRMDGTLFRFARDEKIVTEHSYKYRVDEFQRLAASAGYVPGAAWTDAREWFSLLYFERPVEKSE